MLSSIISTLRRGAVALPWVAVFGVALSTLPVQAQELAVLSRAEDVLVFYDLTTGEEVERLEVGRFCHELSADADLRYAYTGSYRGNTVHAIDLVKRESRTYAVDGYSHFHGVAAAPAGDFFWVTAEDSAVVLEFDAASGEMTHVWPTSGKRSHMVVSTKDGQKLYVANMESGSITAINRETGETKVIETGDGAEGLGISPDETELWVANRRDMSITIIDMATDEPIGSLPSGGKAAMKLEYHPNGKEIWVTNHRDQTVGIYDRETRVLADTINVGERPLGMTFNQDGSRAYVARTRSAEVVEIDTASRTVLRRIPTIQNPDGLVWLPKDHGKE